MVTATTHDIEIRVETSFQPDYSVPNSAENIFAYRITITNKGHFTVQLLRRHWFIYDGPRVVREVEGEGVVGETPILAPGEQHVSGGRGGESVPDLDPPGSGRQYAL